MDGCVEGKIDGWMRAQGQMNGLEARVPVSFTSDPKVESAGCIR